jgi:hypothetical protein
MNSSQAVNESINNALESLMTEINKKAAEQAAKEESEAQRIKREGEIKTQIELLRNAQERTIQNIKTICDAKIKTLRESLNPTVPANNNITAEAVIVNGMANVQKLGNGLSDLWNKAKKISK